MSGGDGRVFVYNVGADLPEGGEMSRDEELRLGILGKLNWIDREAYWKYQEHFDVLLGALAALKLVLPSIESPELLQSVAECLGVEQDTEDR